MFTYGSLRRYIPFRIRNRRNRTRFLNIPNIVNINFVTFSNLFGSRQLQGDILSIFVIAFATAEAAIVLAIVSS